jgi:hypothetical protein
MITTAAEGRFLNAQDVKAVKPGKVAIVQQLNYTGDVERFAIRNPIEPPDLFDVTGILRSAGHATAKTEQEQIPDTGHEDLVTWYNLGSAMKPDLLANILKKAELIDSDLEKRMQDEALYSKDDMTPEDHRFR